MKKTVLWSMLFIIVIVIFNVLFFLIGGKDHMLAVWIDYVFIHVAFVLALLTPVLVRDCSERHLFGLTLSAVSGAYLIVEIIVGVVLMLFVKIGFKTALIIQLVILAVYAIILIVNMLANEYTADAVERHEQEQQYIKEATLGLQAVLDKTKDRGAAKKIQRAYDAIMASPLKSNQNAAEVEREVLGEILRLRSYVDQKDYDSAKDTADEICQLAAERNRMLKMSR